MHEVIIGVVVAVSSSAILFVAHQVWTQLELGRRIKYRLFQIRWT